MADNINIGKVYRKIIQTIHIHQWALCCLLPFKKSWISCK